jgi:hypothetical protein
MFLKYLKEGYEKSQVCKRIRTAEFHAISNNILGARMKKWGHTRHLPPLDFFKKKIKI